MKTHQIENILGLQDDCTRRHFLGVFPSDLLRGAPPRRKREFIVCNLDKHTLEGSHWVALSLEKKHGGRTYRGEYYDSFGQSPTKPHILNYLNKYCNGNWTWNSRQVQSKLADTCGQ